jgi:hypothetical protein
MRAANLRRLRPCLKNAWRNQACVSGRLESRRTRALQLLLSEHDIQVRSLRGDIRPTAGVGLRSGLRHFSIRPAHSLGLIFLPGGGAQAGRRVGQRFSDADWRLLAFVHTTFQEISRI